MHALDILGDPVRRRILELLADGERSAGEIGDVIRHEFGISQPGVSQHLRVLRESGFTTVRPDGTRRIYAVDPDPLATANAWFDPFRSFWQPHFDALGIELARARRARRLANDTQASNDAETSNETGTDAAASVDDTPHPDENEEN